MSDFQSKYQKLRNALSANEEMKEIKERLNDARSKFMVRFRYPDTTNIAHFPYQRIGIIRTLGALDTVMDGIEDLRKHVGFFKILNYSSLISVRRVKSTGD